MFDVFDVQLSEEESRFVLPAEIGGEAVLDSVIGMTIVEAGGIYDPLGDQQGFSLFYGTRILAERAEIGARFEIAPEMSAAESFEAEETLVDGLFGVRYVNQISRHWSYQARLDASAGATELTWSAENAIRYAFGESGRYMLQAGYRHMDVDFEAEDALDVDLTLSGFLAGLRISF